MSLVQVAQIYIYQKQFGDMLNKKANNI